MSEETSVELEATGRHDDRKHGISYVDGTFMLRFAHGVYVEESLELLRRLLHEAMERFNAEARRGHAVLDDGTTAEWLSIDDEVRSER
jgi:hypothetical protein